MAVLYRSPDGRELSEEDLQSYSGFEPDAAPWDEASVPDRARELLERGRELGAGGRHDEALGALAQAQALAMKWPAPTYEAAGVLLLKGEAEVAEDFYGKVNRLAPKGFLQSRALGDTLRRERLGLLPKGTLAQFLRIEGLDHGAGRRLDLELLLAKSRAFPAGWLMLAGLADSADERLRAVEAGLSHDPDAETRGLLLVLKANLLGKDGRRDEAVAILGPLALDREAPHSVEQAAKMSLKTLSTRRVEVFADAEALRVALFKTAARGDPRHLAALCLKNKELIYKNFFDWTLLPDAVAAVPAKKEEWERGLRAVAKYFEDFGDPTLSAKLKTMTGGADSLDKLWTRAKQDSDFVRVYAAAFLGATVFVPAARGERGESFPIVAEREGKSFLFAFDNPGVIDGFFDDPPEGYLELRGDGFVASLRLSDELFVVVNPHSSPDQILGPELLRSMQQVVQREAGKG